MLKPGQRNIAVLRLRPDVHHCVVVVAIGIDTQTSDTVWMEARLDFSFLNAFTYILLHVHTCTI